MARLSQNPFVQRDGTMRDSCAANDLQYAPEQVEAQRKLREYLERAAWDEAMQVKRERWLWERPKPQKQ